VSNIELFAESIYTTWEAMDLARLWKKTARKFSEMFPGLLLCTRRAWKKSRFSSNSSLSDTIRNVTWP